ncbi:retinol dehydrogenase 12-like isoform X2 [Stegodyphus dumicola]|uniref:retinol dehydrogenase 12-like isoform X2 n=1 Tax=Stegodyphus dumicola TaxID=202533 RepID=UPI0015AA184A|nr:retinol dehydrogenase 12-like isoform X2 [Stegodyphus dumicola]
MFWKLLSSAFVGAAIVLFIWEICSAGFLIYLRGFVFSRKCRSTALLHGKTVLITGGNTGIGKETALDLAGRGAKVIIACRDVEKGNDAVEEIQQKVPDANIIVKHLDLASLRSIRKFAEDILHSEPFIHILINNAGIAGCPKSKTEDGFEMQFGVNHLGHFLLTNLLLERIKVSSPARIVNVSSLAHIFGKINFNDINLDHGYHPLLAYARSKLANILFTRELAKRLKGTGINTYCLHPGVVHTGLGRHLGHSISRIIGVIYQGCSRMFFLSPYKGAQTTIYCAVEESLAYDSGYYYSDCTKVQPSTRATDDDLAKKLWEVSENLVSV